MSDIEDRTLSARRLPDPQEQQSRESNAPKKHIIIRISKRKHPDLETLIPTVAQIGLENLIEAQALSYTIAKNVKEYEAHQKVKHVKEKLLDETESLSLDKYKLMELMASKPSSSSSKPTSNRTKHIQGAIARMRRRHGYMLQHMMKSFMPRHDMNTLLKKLEETLKEVVPKMVDNTTYQNMQDNLPWLVKKAVSTGISNKVPPQIDAFIKNNMNNNILHVHLTSSLSSYILDLQQQIYFKMRDDEQAQYVDFALWIALKYKYKKTSSHVEPCRIDAFRRQDHKDHHDDNARLEGESSAKLQKRPRKMKRYMKNKIVWENKAEDLTLHVLDKPRLAYQGCEIDPNDPPRADGEMSSFS
uniref:Uncharacterized protein n=1 Tax=Tanacetum cinerariifolium TaxID=118510 RepID=A0A699HPS3_TANCI|nr:hypothetical protein [Tanacetum cinerariifolium]